MALGGKKKKKKRCMATKKKSYDIKLQKNKVGKCQFSKSDFPGKLDFLVKYCLENF